MRPVQRPSRNIKKRDLSKKVREIKAVRLDNDKDKYKHCSIYVVAYVKEFLGSRWVYIKHITEPGVF